MQMQSFTPTLKWCWTETHWADLDDGFKAWLQERGVRQEWRPIVMGVNGMAKRSRRRSIILVVQEAQTIHYICRWDGAVTQHHAAFYGEGEPDDRARAAKSALSACVAAHQSNRAALLASLEEEAERERRDRLLQQRIEELEGTKAELTPLQKLRMRYIAHG